MAKNPFTWIRTVVLNNWALKLLAVGLGILSFYAIRGAISFEVRYSIPVDVKVEPGVAILDQNPRTVDVTFRGSQDNLRQLEQKYLKVVLRPKLTGSGDPQRLDIIGRDIEAARNVRVVDIRPGVVVVTFDREHTRLVPVVTPKTIGRPLIGKAELDYEPRFVTLRGPRLRLQETTSVTTEPVDVDGRVESFTKQVRVLAPGNTLVSEIAPPEITVTVKIVTETASRTIPNLRILAVTTPGSGMDVRFDPSHVGVTLHGRAEELDAIADSSVQVFVNCVGLDPTASYELPVQVHMPQEANVSATVEPQSVKAILRLP